MHEFVNLKDLEDFVYVDPVLTDSVPAGIWKIVEDVWTETVGGNTKFSPRPYQKKLAALYTYRKKNICAGAQGLGKTLITGLTIASVYRDLRTKRPGTIQIAVPTLLSASLRWQTDLESIPHLKGYIEVMQSERQIVNSTKPIWIYTHDFLKRKSNRISGNRSFLSKLIIRLRRSPSFLIVDEAHHLKPGTLRSYHLSNLRHRAKRVLLLSGTLSDGRLNLIHHLVKFCYGNVFGITEKQFITEFGTTTAVRTNYLVGEEQLDDIPPRYMSHLSVYKVADYYDLLKSKIHRVTLNDPSVKSCVELPSITTYPPEVRRIDLTVDHRQNYDQLVLSYRQSLQQCLEFGNSFSGRAKAFSVLNTLILESNAPDLEYPAKAEECVNLVRQLTNEGLKTVVFASRVPTGRLLTSLLKERLGDSTTVRLYAEDPEVNPKKLSSAQREEVVSNFLFNPDVQCGVMAINLAGESIDLTSASAVIFYDLPWNSIKVQQSISRVRRPGSVRNYVKIFYLLHNKTIDEHIYTLIQEKMRQSTLMLDYDNSQEVSSDVINPLDVISQILCELN